VSPSGSNREMMGPRLGAARLCDAGHGEAWQGVAGLCEAGRCRAWRGLARPGAVRQGEAEQGMDSGVGEILPGVRTPGMVLTGPGEATYGRAWQGVARYGKAWPCAARRSKARRGAARHGEARLGEAGLGKVRQGLAPLGVAIPGRAVRCMARRSKARHSGGGAVKHFDAPGETRLGPARLCVARYGLAGHGAAGHGSARHGSDRPCEAGRCMARHGGARQGKPRSRRGVQGGARVRVRSQEIFHAVRARQVARLGVAGRCSAGPGWARARYGNPREAPGQRVWKR
jgi:hypothetical protein